MIAFALVSQKIEEFRIKRWVRPVSPTKMVQAVENKLAMNHSCAVGTCIAKTGKVTTCSPCPERSYSNEKANKSQEEQS